MVSFDKNTLNLSGLIHCLKSKSIILVNVLVLHLDCIVVDIKRSELSCLLWINHVVLGEFDKHYGVQGGESFLVEVVFGMLLFVVEEWEEDGILQV